MKRTNACIGLMAGLWPVGVCVLSAQELEPRRWSHLPNNVHFAGAAYVLTEAAIAFDPVLELDDVTLDMHTFAASYIRTFEWLHHTMRVDVTVPYQEARWDGLLRGEPAATSRQGFADPVVRFSVNLAGSPPLAGEDFARYQAEHPVSTIVGAGVAVQVPLENTTLKSSSTWVKTGLCIRPAVGVMHNHGKWSEELTGSVWLFTDNDDFFGGNRREQDPRPMVQAHLIYTFRPGVWTSVSAGYAHGGESRVNGVAKDDAKKDGGLALSFGYSFSRAVGVKIAYAHTESWADTGFDSDNLLTALSMMW